MASEEPQSLRAAFEDAESKRAALEASPNATSPTYASDLDALLGAYSQILNTIDSVSLFSPNEGVEDISTSALPYLLVHFTIAELVQRAPYQPGNAGPQRRKAILRSARDAYERFLSLVDGYGLVTGPYAKLLERYRDDEERFAVVATGGGAQDMAAKRDAKIASFRAEKVLKDKLALLRSDPRYRGDEEDSDDEIARQLYLTNVTYSIHQAFQGLESLNREAEMLAMAPPPQPEHPSSNDRPVADDPTLRLDRPFGSGLGGGRGGPLLSQKGKPLQPFTLVGSRAERAKGVFRPGHNLPTMSIDEYLEEEKRRGGILEGGTDPPKKVVDEDDMEAVDRETYKAREWDDYKDDNRRGAGNTMNMG